MEMWFLAFDYLQHGRGDEAFMEKEITLGNAFEDIHEISDWRQITSHYEMKAGFMKEKVIFGKKQLTSSGWDKITRWLDFALRLA